MPFTDLTELAPVVGLVCPFWMYLHKVHAHPPRCTMQYMWKMKVSRRSWQHTPVQMAADGPICIESNPGPSLDREGWGMGDEDGMDG